MSNKIELSRRLLMITLFAATCLGGMFLTSGAFVNRRVTPKWFCVAFGGLALALYWTVLKLFRYKTPKLQELALPIFGIAAAVCTLQAVYGLLQSADLMPHIRRFRLNGSFDNPAGFAACICAGAPLLLPFIVSKLKWMRYSALVSVGLIALSVVLSGSRAGMLSLTVVSVLYLCNRFRIKLIFPLIACVVLAVGLYFVKKDSADGRLLIWRVSSEMFKEKPALGYGYGGFNANYMNFQARYFEAHPDSKYARIADNVRNPFNEYVKLLVNYGFAGLVAFLTLCSFLYLSFRRIKNKTITDYAALYALEAIAVFAFFSYPLTYPFVLIVGTVNVLLIYSRAEYKLKKTPPVWVNICVIALIAAIAVFTANKMEEQMQWASIARKSLKGQTEEMLSEYERLYKTMKNNDLFMYNYAAELNTAGYPDESIKIALECERMLADYDLQMLLAENYRQLKRYREAEQRYQFASLMCPVKFAPLYELAKMYEESGDIHRAKLLAEQILKKQVKIHSTQIEKMKKEMKALLDMYIQ